MRYEFIEVPFEGGLKAGKTDTFEKCKKIINEKWSSYAFLNYTLLFKVND